MNSMQKAGPAVVAEPASQSIAQTHPDTPIVLLPAVDAKAWPTEFLPAYLVLVRTPRGVRRRPFLALGAAEKAVERARARGDLADAVLCEVRPIGGGAL
ncbi:hypothetical protein [Kineococcus arenarius]|uniref:hypothetical protein n=1 Tax=Kineococcus sp. SYSU DK007 TaxID=3383128 RepID=UPI003D7DA58F